ncbi:MAG: type II secretion system protein [Bacilli bacterium]
MKNKKGFTLIELLAVIAILAILVVLTVPNILGMFNKGKKSAFVTQSKEILSTAQSQYVVDSLSSTPQLKYCWDGTSPLVGGIQLSGDTKVHYYVEFDASGNVIKFNITSATYGYNLSSLTGVFSKDITDDPGKPIENFLCSNR